jgi:hypothetical protein
VPKQKKSTEVKPLAQDCSEQPSETVQPRRTRKLAVPPTPVEIPHELLNDAPRMKYALLLALLLRQNGTVKFSGKDLQAVDTDYNIVFARTLDGRALEVTVVSATSGILKSPENMKGDAQWSKDVQTFTQPIYNPPPSPMETAQAIVSGTSPIATVLQMPQHGDSPTIPRDGSAPFQFPFEVGDRPATAGPIDLNLAAQTLLVKDRLIAQQEQEAIARQEQGQ